MRNIGCKYPCSNYEVILYPTQGGKAENFLYREYGDYEKHQVTTCYKYLIPYQIK